MHGSSGLSGRLDSAAFTESVSANASCAVLRINFQSAPPSSHILSCDNVSSTQFAQSSTEDNVSGQLKHITEVNGMTDTERLVL